MEERLETFFGALIAGANPRLRARTRKRDWPHSRSSARSVALAGFVYRPTNKEPDRTECVDCGSFCSDWKAAKLRNPAERHLELDPNCARYPKTQGEISRKSSIDAPQSVEDERKATKTKESPPARGRTVLPPDIIDHVKDQLAKSTNKPALALRFLEQMLSGIGNQANVLLSIISSDSQKDHASDVNAGIHPEDENDNSTSRQRDGSGPMMTGSPSPRNSKRKLSMHLSLGRPKSQSGGPAEVGLSPSPGATACKLNASPLLRPPTHVSHARPSSMLFRISSSPSKLPSPICAPVKLSPPGLSPPPKLCSPLCSPLASPLKLTCEDNRRDSFSTQMGPNLSYFHFQSAMRNLGIAMDDQFDALLSAISPYLNIFEFYNTVEDYLINHIDSVTELGICAIETEARQVLETVKAV